MNTDQTIWIDKEGKKQRSYAFQDTEKMQILNNPGKLTREGVEKKIYLWKRSGNKHTEAKYKAMLQRCQNLTESGFVLENMTFKNPATGDTETKEVKLMIYSRNQDGTPKWIETVEEYKEANRNAFFQTEKKVREVKAETPKKSVKK